MSFSSGTFSFRRFTIGGKSPKTVEQSHLDQLSEHILDPESGSTIEVDYGWCGGRHLLDGKFDFEHNVFNDAISCGLRVDTNSVPAELKKAYKILEEDALAAGNPSGFISKKQKASVKETLAAKVEKDLRSGKFRRGKMTPVMWDFIRHMVYSPANTAAGEYLIELFGRTFDLELLPLTAGTLAQHILQPLSRRRDYEDLRPTRFVPGNGGEGEFPEYPWTAKGPQPKDFLGNEFLVWLWHEADAHHGSIRTGDGEMTVMFEKFLDLDCAYGQSGRAGLRATGPTRMPEARDAIRTGKVPRKAGLIVETGGHQFSFTYNAESLFVGSLTMPDIPHADTPRTLFEERIGLLRDLCEAMDGAYAHFVKLRCSGAWEGQVAAIRKWILHTPRPATAVA